MEELEAIRFDIHAGTMDNLKPESGDWLIVDVGFSQTRKSCGVLINKERPRTMKFSCLMQYLVKEAQIDTNGPLNLLLEAPLTAAFDKSRNPVRRSTDIEEDKKPRDWYVGAAGALIQATTYLLRSVYDCERKREVRLFEGFASFKSSRPEWPYDKAYGFSKTDWSHIEDVLRLRCAAWDADRKLVTRADKLKMKDSDCLESAFKVAGMDFEIPPVIKACKCEHDLIRHHLQTP